MPDVRYVLWDFGDTLVDERWMWACPEGVPDWRDSWHALVDDLAGPWNRGELTFEEFAMRLAADVGMGFDDACAHMRRCCRAIRFFDHAWAKARSHDMPQAIVTVNPDLFTRFIVPNYDLDTVFDTIVTSWQEGTEDKARLCEIALHRLGGADPAEALLIDNIEANVDAWRARGGQAYLFVGDDEFARSGALRSHF
jgi:phosphoglycolate phosphatase-like HAD superfamily hydrolase